MTTPTRINIELAELRPRLLLAIENITTTCYQQNLVKYSEENLTLDCLAHAVTAAVNLAESMFDDDPDDRDARSLIYDSDTVRDWLQSMIFL